MMRMHEFKRHIDGIPLCNDRSPSQIVFEDVSLRLLFI